MIPRTYPSTDASNGQSQLIGYYLGSIEGLTRWVDYIPVRFNSYLNGPENTYDLNGYIPVSSISSITGLTPFKDYVPLYIDNTSTDVWTSDVDGYIPIGLKKSNGASLELDFTKTTTLDSRITFTRASTATYFDSTGVMQTAAINAPRFDFDPASKEPKGLLIEEQRTNLALYSEQFNNAVWADSSTTSTTRTADQIAAPDGTTTADLILNTTTLNRHTFQQSFSVASGTATYSASVYIKKYIGSGTPPYFVFYLGNSFQGLNRAGIFVNTSTFTVDSTVFTAGSGTLSGYSVTPVGNDWYKITISASTGETGAVTIRMCFGISNTVLSGPLSNSYIGDGNTGFYLWGAQLEAATFATSYIPTVASQVTRSADNARMTGTNFSSWYNQSEGTIYAEGFLNNPAVTGAQIRRLAEVNDGSSNNRISFGYASSSGTLRSQYVASGVSLNGTNGQTASSVFPSAKVAVAYKVADYAFSPKGASATTSTAANVPVVNTLSIGNEASNNALGSANGTIRKIAYYPIRLTNSQLQALTL